MRYFFFIAILFAFLFPTLGLSQITPENPNDSLIIDTGKKDSISVYNPSIKNYQQTLDFTHWKVLDTTFSVQNTLRLPYPNHKKNFDKLLFSNIGSGFQKITPGRYSSIQQDINLLPEIKSFFYIPKDSVHYYSVATPTTSFNFNSGIKNGAALQSHYTQNIGKNFNFSIGYQGIRSLGLYQNDLTSVQNFLVSAHFASPKVPYRAYGHYNNYINNHQENGGIVSLDNYYNLKTFRNRQNLATNLIGAVSQTRSRRYYLRQRLDPFFFKKINSALFLETQYSTTHFLFSEAAQNNQFFGTTELIPENSLGIDHYSRIFSNTAGFEYESKLIKSQIGFLFENQNFGVNDGVTSPTSLQYSDKRIGIKATAQVLILNKYALSTEAEVSQGSVLKNKIYSFSKVALPLHTRWTDSIAVSATFSRALPPTHWLLHRSRYSMIQYNNVSTALPTTSLRIEGITSLPFYKSVLMGGYYQEINPFFWDENAQPKQQKDGSSSLSFFYTQASAEIPWGQFKFIPEIRIQKALTGNDILPLPTVISRLHFLYEINLFKNAMRFRGGARIGYTSGFASRDFLPHLGEFILPNNRAYSIGNHPSLDLIAHAKVKPMLIFIEGLSLETLFLKNEAFAAPYYPSGDFRLNISFQWRLFH